MEPEGGREGETESERSEGGKIEGRNRQLEDGGGGMVVGGVKDHCGRARVLCDVEVSLDFLLQNAPEMGIQYILNATIANSLVYDVYIYTHVYIYIHIYLLISIWRKGYLIESYSYIEFSL